VSFQEQLEPEAAARERLVFGLRRLAGIEMANFKSASGFSVQQLGGEKIAKWIAAGLVSSDGKALRLTRRGLMVSDSLWPELL
jgi:oxygen-independent coproporphyrinogen-3 oxidase